MSGTAYTYKVVVTYTTRQGGLAEAESPAVTQLEAQRTLGRLRSNMATAARLRPISSKAGWLPGGELLPEWIVAVEIEPVDV